MELSEFIITIADITHFKYVDVICNEIESSAKLRGTGIAKRSPDYIKAKITEGKAVIALTKENAWAGFCYTETWEGEYVANSGLIVAPQFRKSGLARAIKSKIFELSRTKYPNAKIFGLTTSLAVMKINSEMGYEPVTYSELTNDEKFWSGCKSCINYEILMNKERKNCLCTAMLYNPTNQKNIANGKIDEAKKFSLYERFMSLKQSKLLNQELKPNSETKQNKFLNTLFQIFS